MSKQKILPGKGKKLGKWVYTRAEAFDPPFFSRAGADGESVAWVSGFDYHNADMSGDERPTPIRWSIEGWDPPSGYPDVGAKDWRTAKARCDAQLQRLGYELEAPVKMPGRRRPR